MNKPTGSSSESTGSELNPPEITLVDTHRVWCDGAGDIRGGAQFQSAALGHPRVWLEIDERGYAECGYCDRRFVLRDEAAAH
jgi:NADH dehydrogenase (ubiquinone) Fe-S protein 6